MSIRSKAKSVGTKDREAKENLADIVKAYNKAGAEGKAEILLDYKVGYIAGYAKVSMSVAERILSEGKVNRGNTLAIDAAVASVAYHFRKKPSGDAQQKSMRIQAHIREAAMTFLGEFEGETLADQIAKALKVLNAMK